MLFLSHRETIFHYSLNVMGMLSDNQIYYYFKLRHGVEYAIKETVIQINTDIMRNFRELSSEQREFYLANPEASVQEVVNCELTAPYVPPTPELSEYVARKQRELKEACLGSISVSSIEYAMANACLAGSSLTYSGRQHYTSLQAKAIMKQFMDESDEALDVYETYSESIANAVSTESVDALYNEALSQLNS